jgi:uncharacterized membrane protein YtjA (UPF0391 family)
MLRPDYTTMLTWAVVFLFLAIIAGVFGMLVAGPAGPILFVVFFALFIGSLVRDRRDRTRRH